MILITREGTYIWGRNDNGRLGNNTTSDVRIPTLYNYNIDFAKVLEGGNFSVGLSKDGYLYSTGTNNNGQLGLGDTKNRVTMEKIGSKKWKDFSVHHGGTHVLAIDEDDFLYAWGRTIFGRLGNGVASDTAVSSPAQIGTMKWKKVFAGNDHSAGLTIDNKLYTWGYNSRGNLGDGTTTNRVTPTLAIIDDNISIKEVYSSGTNSIIMTDNGVLYGAGQNNYGLIGLTARTTFGKSTINVKFKKLSLGSTHVLAIDENGDLYSWGNNSNAQLGTGNTVAVTTPTKVNSSIKWKDVYAYNSHSIGLASNGDIYIWGNGGSYDLGNNSTGLVQSPTLLRNFVFNDNRLFFKSKNKIQYINNNILYESNSLNIDSMPNKTSENFSLLLTDKNYILTQNNSQNQDGLLVTQINRKPLSIKFE